MKTQSMFTVNIIDWITFLCGHLEIINHPVAHRLNIMKHMGDLFFVCPNYVFVYYQLFVGLSIVCRGFPATSVRYFLQKIGLEPRLLKKATGEIATVAETTSRWIWLTRARSWNPGAGES